MLFYVKQVYLGTGPPRSVLFNIFMNNPDKRMECTLIMFSDDTKLGGAVSVLKGRGCHSEGPWETGVIAYRNLTKFTDECKAPHLGRKSTLQ